MADKVYPASKPVPAPPQLTTVNGGANPTFPPTKAQLYTRPVYRPQAPPKRRRSCLCSCCIWTTLLIILLLLLAAVSGVVIWLVYRPQRSNFTVSSFQVAKFNLTATQLTSKFNFTLSARNPNKKIVIYYDPISISAYSNGVDVGSGSFPGFVLDTKNTTSLRAVIEGQSFGDADISSLQSDLKKQKNSLGLKIEMNTKMRAKIGSLKTKRIRIRVTCDGAQLKVPGEKSPPSVTTSNLNCKTSLRVKIWKWTVYTGR